MNQKRLLEILKSFPSKKILVAGDFILDQYLMLNHDISEVSLETGLESYQAYKIKNSPGAAGTVANGLSSMDVKVIGLGVYGKDGLGLDLKEELIRRKIDMSYMIESDQILTAAYMKPILTGKKELTHEISRIDIRTRAPIPEEIEKQILSNLENAFIEADGMMIVDQIPESYCGVITENFRKKTAELAEKFPEKPILVDSRLRSGLFKNAIIKCNQFEALQAAKTNTLDAAAAVLYEKNPRGVFITLAEKGIMVCSKDGRVIIPAVPEEGPFDITGAGNSADTGIISSLCSGSTFEEAGEIGNLIAAITIKQIGTTGTAKRGQVEAINNKYEEAKNKPLSVKAEKSEVLAVEKRKKNVISSKEKEDSKKKAEKKKSPKKIAVSIKKAKDENQKKLLVTKKSARKKVVEKDSAEKKTLKAVQKRKKTADKDLTKENGEK